MAAYARVAVTRDGSGWTVSGNSGTLAATASFPAMSGGAGGTVTHFGLGTASSAAGHLLFFGTVTPNISCVAGVTPKLSTSTAVNQTTVDAMTNEAATAFLNLVLNNIDWPFIGDAGGLQNSAANGSLYLSLHTASPAETGDQTTSELGYT